VRIFLDTNVLVSAFATRGLSADLFEAVSIEHELVTGRAVLKELERALRVKLKLSASRSAEAVDLIATEATLVVEHAITAACAADEDDRLILGEALAGQAELFVTGDAALLGIERLGKMRIVSPRQLWEILQNE